MTFTRSGWRRLSGSTRRRTRKGRHDPMNHIGPTPSPEMYVTQEDIDCQCARCGSSCDYERCWNCEDGYSDHDCGEDCCMCRHPEPNVRCDICDGRGGWNNCLSPREWCKAHPLSGRQDVERGSIEWFTIERGA